MQRVKRGVLATTAAVAALAVSAVPATANDSASGSMSGPPNSAGPDSISATNNGSATLYNFAVMPTGGLTVMSGSCGPGGSFILNGNGSGSGECNFPGGIAPGAPFSMGVTWSGAYPCVPVNVAVAEMNPPYSPYAFPWSGGSCSGGGGPVLPQLNQAFGVQLKSPFQNVPSGITIFVSTVVGNPSSSAATSPTTLGLVPGGEITLRDVLGPGVTPGTTPGTFNLPAIAPGGSLSLDATFGDPVALPFGHSQQAVLRLEIGGTPVVNPPSVFIGGGIGTFTGAGLIPSNLISGNAPTGGPRARASAPVRTGRGGRLGVWGTFRSTLPAGATNKLAPGVADPNQITRVQVALVRVTGRPKKIVEGAKARKAAAPNCVDVLANGSTQREQVRRGVCTGLVWLDATIRPGGRWYYAFNPLMPTGNFTAYVRAITRAGIGDPSVVDQYAHSVYRYVFYCAVQLCGPGRRKHP